MSRCFFSVPSLADGMVCVGSANRVELFAEEYEQEPEGVATAMVDDEIERRVLHAQKTGVFVMSVLMDTEAALSRLSGFTSLRRVELKWCPGLTDASLRHLASLTSLEELVIIVGMKIGDEGLAVLDALTGLTRIMLMHCANITDALLSNGSPSIRNLFH